MTILYVGIDLAKNVFALHGVNEATAASEWNPAERLDSGPAPNPECHKAEPGHTQS